MIFKDRFDAGIQLATKLSAYKNRPDVVVIGLPRGGVVTAEAVAKALNAPLDIVVPRKIGAPHEEELAIGAITEDGEVVLDDEEIKLLNVSKEYIEKTVAMEKAEALRRLSLYRADRSPLNLKAKTALLVDDGVATGATMRAAIRSARIKGAQKIVVAVPVIAADTLRVLKAESDECIFLDAPDYFDAVGSFYETFPQTTDQEVVKILSGK